MKKFVASIGFAALVAAPAMAADMPVKTSAPKEPAFTVYNWTGFYVGMQMKRLFWRPLFLPPRAV
jgi:opacity protein-like surface antigen